MIPTRSRPHLVHSLALIALLASTLHAQQPPSGSGDTKAGFFDALKYRYIGPPGNRVSAVAGEPGNSNVYYAGAASGGVWKSSDGGSEWTPIFDSQSAQSIGAIAIAPSDTNVVWVGTGETFIRSNVSLGNGVYKSTDAGKTWTHMGLDKTGRIGRILIDPRNPEVVFVAALGTCYGPQQERGVYRTTDGGKTWERVLFVDENTGASEITMDPNNPRHLFAGMWQIDIKTWGRNSGGPGSGVFSSRDGGATWKRITGHGLPEPPLGKIAVAVAPSEPNRVYALIETGDKGSLWRSDDGGENWKLVNHSRLLNERPHYYTRMLVMPDNALEVYFPSNSMSVTRDGGETADLIDWFGDNHDMWADPKDPNRMMIGHDEGVGFTTTRGKSWSFVRLPIAQMYHVATDNRVPYNVYGQEQDNTAWRGPSNSRNGGEISASEWSTTAGCETGWSTPDPVDDNIVWGGCYAGVVERHDLRTGMTRSVSVWPDRTMGANAGEVKVRMNWTFPIAISPHDHNEVYVGSQYVHRTRDGGQTWETISPDLTLNDPAMHGDSGGLTVDNLSVEYAGVVYSLAESPAEKGQIWAGTNDGQLQVTRDGGAHWTNVTPKLKGMPDKMTVSSVEPSKYDAGTCYVAFDGHQVNAFDPYLLKTTDYGKTWKRVTDGIPASPLSYTHVVREDPVRKGLLYAGTENGLFVSFNDGENWEPLQNNLPHAPVYWLTVQPHFNDLVVGTYGRGFWIMDDVTPLQTLTDETRKAEASLLAPRPAYRFRKISRRNGGEGTEGGRNPRYGADINFLLKTAMKEKLEIAVFNQQGEKVRTLKVDGKAGLNRVWWDLRYEPQVRPALRTTPAANPHVWEEKRFKGKDTRDADYYGIWDLKAGPLVVPGTYTLKLKVGTQELSQNMTVLKDPNSPGSEADVQAQAKMSLDIYRDANSAAAMINQLEWTRLQIEQLTKLEKAAKANDTVKALAELDSKARAVEDKLLQPTIAEADLKSFRHPLQLYFELLWLGAEVGTGAADVSGSPDLPPTQPEIDVYQLLHGRLTDARKEFDDLYQTAIPAFNERFAGQHVQVAPGPQAGE